MRRQYHSKSAADRDDTNPYLNGHVSDDSSDKRQRQWLCNRYLYAFFVMISLLFWIINWEHTRSIRPVSIEESVPGQFVAEHARENLNKITSFGLRIVGSHANEVEVVQYLISELEAIKRNAKSVHKLDVDLQTTSGTFTLEFLGEFSSSYDNLQNVVAKFGPVSGANDSLLVNCHYDSVVTSVGASDDAVSCALMLEVLRSLSQEHLPLMYNVIFLFNGAEENILQASHGFITQHKWANQVRAVVNLDAAGSGGKELVFQAGPEYPWLIKTYAQVTKYPFASSVGQEIFQSGIIPSDTDYRIFRDFGHVPGIDIAYIYNGYVYHTRFDTADRIDDGCIQRGGDNLLALVRALANSRQLVSPSDDDRHGNMVYYDLIGQMVMIYPQRMGTLLNSMTVILVVLDTMRRIVGRGGGHYGVTGKEYVTGILKACLALSLSTVGVMITVSGLAMGLTLLGANMTWFHHTEFLTLLYVLPALVAYLTVHSVAKRYLFSSSANFWQVEFIFFEANLICCTAILAILTAIGIRSAFILLMWVIIPFIVRVKLPQVIKLNFKDHTVWFFTIHLSALSFPLLIFAYLVFNFFVVFAPLMGRMGPVVNPDLLMGCVAGMCVCIAMSYSAGIIYLVRNIRRTILTLCCVSLCAYLVALFTDYGFPYSGDPRSPAPQRQIFTAIKNTHHDLDGDIIREDAHLLFLPFDYNSLYHVLPLIPEFKDAVAHECEGPQCGLPYFYPVLPLCSKQYKIPIEKWERSTPTVATLTKRTPGESKYSQIFHFAVTGPTHMSMYIELESGTNLTRWSIGNGIPHPTKMVDGYTKDNFFVYYSYGKKPEKPWTFWIEVEDTGKAER